MDLGSLESTWEANLHLEQPLSFFYVLELNDAPYS